MDAKTLEALQGSIKKWEDIAAGAGQDRGWANCPLCLMFNNAEDEERCLGCRGCPVATSGHYYCDGTPYDIWSALPGRPRVATNLEHKTVAQAELDFLKSLLPAEAAPHTSAERAP